MRTNGYERDSHITQILKSILREIAESAESCRNDQSVHRHHRIAAKNIEINLLEVEPLTQNKAVLKSLYAKATEDLSKLNRLIKKSPLRTRCQEHSESSINFSRQIKDKSKETRQLQSQIQSLKEKIKVLQEQNGLLLEKVKQNEFQSTKAAEGLMNISDQLTLQQQQYAQKWQLATTQIKELRKQLTQALYRNQNLIQQCNALQNQNCSLARQKSHFQQQMQTLLDRIDNELNFFSQRQFMTNSENQSLQPQTYRNQDESPIISQRDLKTQLLRAQNQDIIRKETTEIQQKSCLNNLREQIRKLKKLSK